MRRRLPDEDSPTELTAAMKAEITPPSFWVTLAAVFSWPFVHVFLYRVKILNDHFGIGVLFYGILVVAVSAAFYGWRASSNRSDTARLGFALLASIVAVAVSLGWGFAVCSASRN